MEKEWAIGDVVSKEEYTQAAVYCNDKGDRHIEKKGSEYIVCENIIPEPTIDDKIVILEQQVTARNIRSALLGDEYAINKITQIEAQIEELRKQLEVEEQ
jgi:hypothetical protein